MISISATDRLRLWDKFSQLFDHATVKMDLSSENEAGTNNDEDKDNKNEIAMDAEIIRIKKNRQ